MLERLRNATVMYLTADYIPAHRDNWDFARIKYDDGKIVYIRNTRKQLADEFTEQEHPRGQPGNRGQFTAKGEPTPAEKGAALSAKIAKRGREIEERKKGLEQLRERLERSAEKEVAEKLGLPPPTKRPDNLTANQAAQFEDMNDSWEEDNPWDAIERRPEVAGWFPNAKDFQIVGERDRGYNCYAWALGMPQVWVEPTEQDAWPGPSDTRLGGRDPDSWDRLLLDYYHGQRTTNEAFEPGFVKVAVMTRATKTGKKLATHAIRQLPDGRWSSKLGQNVLLTHDLHGLEGGSNYGAVDRIFKVPEDDWLRIKEQEYRNDEEGVPT